MPTASIEGYVAAFVARCDTMTLPSCRRVNEPGVRGVWSCSDDAPTRLLVTDDSAQDLLTGLLPNIRAGLINVFAAAPRCTELIAHHRGWKPHAVTAMLDSDLRTVPEAPLPGGLTVRPVRRLAHDRTDGVPLTDAVAAVRAANPSSDDAPEALADHLRSLPPRMRLLAAVDDDGAVRATSGFGTFGAHATVFFVNTDPGWRRRGIGQAMTAVALRSARDAGASHACLDASDAGLALYLRLGFEVVARTTLFVRAG